jgi:hypothetical protein
MKICNLILSSSIFCILLFGVLSMSSISQAELSLKHAPINKTDKTDKTELVAVIYRKYPTMNNGIGHTIFFV